MALVCKRRQQRRHLHQIRSTNLTRVAAPVRALRIAWAWPEETVVPLRALFPTSTPMDARPVRRWLLTGLGLDT